MPERLRMPTLCCVAPAVVVGVAACGGSGTSGPPYHYSVAQRKEIAHRCVETYANAAAHAARETGASLTEGPDATIIKRSAEECECFDAKVEATVPADKVFGAASEIKPLKALKECKKEHPTETEEAEAGKAGVERTLHGEG